MARSAQVVYIRSKKELKTLVQTKMQQKYVDVIDKFAEYKDLSRAACVELLLENVAKEIMEGRIK